MLFEQNIASNVTRNVTYKTKTQACPSTPKHAQTPPSIPKHPQVCTHIPSKLQKTGFHEMSDEKEERRRKQSLDSPQSIEANKKIVALHNQKVNHL